MNLFTPHIGLQDLIILMRNLQMTMKAGVPIARALNLFEEGATRGKRPLFTHLRSSVELGNMFADAMESAPRKFPTLAINLIRAGEKAGSMQESLAMVVQYEGKAYELRRKIRGAMIYPSFLIGAVGGFILLMGGFILPTLLPLFNSLNVALPLSTRVLMWIAVFFQNHGTVFFISLVIAGVVTFWLARARFMRPIVHRIQLGIPLIKGIIRNGAIAQVTRTLSTLLRNGTPIQEALKATADATSNLLFHDLLLRSASSIESGHSLSGTFKSAPKLFPLMTITLIEIGEETGMLSQTLEYLAEFYESEVDYAVKALSIMMEPIILVFMGVIVGWTVMAIILPIYRITGSIA